MVQVIDLSIKYQCRRLTPKPIDKWAWNELTDEIRGPYSELDAQYTAAVENHQRIRAEFGEGADEVGHIDGPWYVVDYQGRR